MTTQTPPFEEERFQNERLSVLVTLAVQPSAPLEDEHPPAERLAAFSEGRLDPTDRERVLTHLDACSDCYNEWLTVANVLAAPLPHVETKSPIPISMPGISHRRRRRTLLWSGASMALAASLALFLLAPWRTDSGLPALIERAYETGQTASAPDLRETALQQTLPWEEPARATYGFSADAANEAARAFAAGLWEGRVKLGGDDGHPATRPALLAPSSTPPATSGAWQNTEWADYTLLGRWVFLLQAICKTPQQGSLPFWNAQRAVAAELHGRLEARAAADSLERPVARVVQSLDATLRESEAAINTRRCEQIKRDYLRLNALLIHSLSP